MASWGCQERNTNFAPAPDSKEVDSCRNTADAWEPKSAAIQQSSQHRFQFPEGQAQGLSGSTSEGPLPLAIRPIPAGRFIFSSTLRIFRALTGWRCSWGEKALLGEAGWL